LCVPSRKKKKRKASRKPALKEKREKNVGLSQRERETFVWNGGKEKLVGGGRDLVGLP